LDFLPVNVLPGVFCFLHGSLDGGERSLVVLERCAEHEAGVLRGGFGIDEVFSVAFFLRRYVRLSLLDVPATSVEMPPSLPKTWSLLEDC
jgi:hypothetical protein